jgi:TerY-C metal binding domain
MNTPKVVIVMAKCSRMRQGFGIRFETKRSRQWTADWAFAIKEAVAKREGYDRSEITGKFEFDEAYPGCPHCRNSSIVLCGCGKVACWNEEQMTVLCPWCGITGNVMGQIERLSAGGDR